MLSHSSFWEFCNLYSTHITGIALIKKLCKLATVSYMPLFYVLSGFTFKYKPGILNQRFNRLLTPYIIWGLICLLLTWCSVCMREYTTLSFLPILLPWSLDTAPAGALFIYVGYQLKEQKFFSNRLWIFCHSIAQTFIFVLRGSSFIKNRFHSKYLCSNNICHDIGKVFPMEKAACTENKLTYIRQIVSEM